MAQWKTLLFLIAVSIVTGTVFYSVTCRKIAEDENSG